MAVLPIYNCFHPVLKKSTLPVENIDEDIKQMVDDMFETMYKADGIGLAANQVGILNSVIVIDLNSGETEKKYDIPPIALINPEIEYFSDETYEYQEGCLSVPKFYENVVRPKIIQVKYFDLEMKEHIEEAEGMLSRVMQHEIDHLLLSQTRKHIVILLLIEAFCFHPD